MSLEILEKILRVQIPISSRDYIHEEFLRQVVFENFEEMRRLKLDGRRDGRKAERRSPISRISTPTTSDRDGYGEAGTVTSSSRVRVRENSTITRAESVARSFSPIRDPSRDLRARAN